MDSKRIEGFPQYLIYKNGDVFCTKTNTFVKRYLRKDGYFQVLLSDKNGKKKFQLLHRLLAIAFIDNPENLPYINHKDGIKTNIDIPNLEWCTASENQLHAYRTGLKKCAITRKTLEASLPSIVRPVLQYDTDGHLLNRWASIAEASREVGLTASQICASCLRRIHTSGGYIWCYEDEENAIEKSLKARSFGYGKKHVFQFSMNGEFIREWESAEEVFKELGFKTSSISLACSGKIQQAYGFFWSRSRTLPEKNLSKIKKKNRSVLQFSVEGNLIKQWSSINDAAFSLKIDNSSISKACRGKSKTAGGYIWKYETIPCVP